MRKIEGEATLTSVAVISRSRVQKEDEDFFAEYFGARGYICTRLDTDNQDKSSDRSETPDFLLEKEGLKIYCEIKSMFEKKDYAKSDEILDRLASRLEKLNHSFDFNLGISEKIKITKLLSKREKEIENFVNNTIKNLNSDISFPFIIKDKSKEFKIELTGKNNLGHLGCHVMGTFRGRDPENNKRISRYINNSVSKFKNYLDKGNSFVLIVFKHHELLDIKPKAFYAYLKGILTLDMNTTISAIALCERIKIDKGYINRFLVFHNPYTKYPLDQKIFADEYNKQHIPKEIRPEEIEFEWIGSEI